MISTINFIHGEKSCAIAPGSFCRWQGATCFGTKPVCMLFDNEPLHDIAGWLQRCKQCITEFKEQQ